MFPARAFAGDGSPIAEDRMRPFDLYGPTCDSADRLPGPFLLPERLGEGDYIEFGNIGAYGRVMATHFNGCGYYDEAILKDEPLLSMYATSEAADETEAAEEPARALAQ